MEKEIKTAGDALKHIKSDPETEVLFLREVVKCHVKERKWLRGVIVMLCGVCVGLGVGLGMVLVGMV